MSARRKSPVLIVCDLDNTLYDWVSFFVPSFYAMVDVATHILKTTNEQLLDELRKVHQRHSDSEHPYALLETDTAKQLAVQVGDDAIARLLDPAFHAFNSARSKTLKLYPKVHSTLRALHEDGYVLVAHTESKFFSAVGRLKRLGVYEYFSHIYCRERSPSIIPDAVRLRSGATFSDDGRVTELLQHQRKPDPEVLLEICRREGYSPDFTIFVGDSLSRDILMANRANVISVWAKYGANPDSDSYRKLVRVTHWTAEEVHREQELKVQAAAARPDFVCSTSFAELFEAVHFAAARTAAFDGASKS